MADEGRIVLRYAVASNMGDTGSADVKDAAYAGSHLLAVAGGIETMWGRSASKIAIDELRGLDTSADASGLAAILDQGVSDLRKKLSALLAGDSAWQGSGTYLTAMLWRDSHAAIVHAGSTRAYMLRDGELTQLTHDHTFGQYLLDADEIGPGELGSDPQHYSVVMRWLDGEREESPDIATHEGAIGDRYLLCTSGIHRLMPPEALRDILRDMTRKPQEVADDIAGQAFPAEEHGEFTCIIADIVSQPDAEGLPAILSGAALR